MLSQKGFTIMELVVVIIILGVLVAIALPRYFSLADDAQLAACLANQKAIEAAIMMEYSDRLLAGSGDTLADVVSAYNGDPGSFFVSDVAPKEPSGGSYTVTASGNMVTVNKLVGVSNSPYAFNSYLSTTPLNVIGNNSAYTVPFDAVLFDLNSDFDTSNYYFVAPVDGIYHFQAEVGMRKLTTSMTEAYLSFVVNSGAPTDQQFTCENIDPSQIIDYIAFTDEVTLKGGVYLVLSAADTVKIVIGLTGAASNTAGVTNIGSPMDYRSWFGGSYIGSV